MNSRSSSATPDPADGRLPNLVGAWALGVADRITASTEAAAARGGRAPAAIVALHQFAEGRTIEELRDVLGLTHSATVRLTDNLVSTGHLVREPHAGDGRAVALTLTTLGRAAARRISRARQEAIEAALANLSMAERRSLEALLSRLTADLTELRLLERSQGTLPAGGWLCRICDMHACGRAEGRCPAATRALGTKQGRQAG